MTKTALSTLPLLLALGACGPSGEGTADGAATPSADAALPAADATAGDTAAPATGACAAISDTVPTVCSMAGAARMALFTNNCTVPVDIWWVNFQCGENFYHRLDPGQSYTQPSFVTHPWRARTAPDGVPAGTAKGMLIKEFGAIPAGADPQAFAVP